MITILTKKYLISKDYDYNISPHKMITTLLLRTPIMIAVLMKCIIYEDCDHCSHDLSPHKNIMFLRLYKLRS